jgi:acyl-CoA reductase-like NAD-dependent aldehyde dehydrogenase
LATTDIHQRSIEVENPANGTMISSVPVLSERDVQELATRARMAQPAWVAIGFEGRARVFDEARRWLIANTPRVIETICSETGKTYEDATLELSIAALGLSFWAKHSAGYLADEKIPSATPFTLGRKVRVRYEAVGLVGVIGPWNYPIVNSFGDCIPAMMAGNTVILKPSEVTPLSSFLMAEMLDECGLPTDVF